MLNEDYKDMLHALSDEKVKFLLVGAYALAAHGYPRATMDIDGLYSRGFESMFSSKRQYGHEGIVS